MRRLRGRARRRSKMTVSTQRCCQLLDLVAFEVLHGSFMPFRRRARPEGPEVSALPGLRISPSGIQTV